MSKMRFSKRKMFLFWFLFLCCCKKKTKKRNEKGPKPYKNGAFYGGHPKMRKIKKMIFSKHCLTRFVSGREKKTRIFMHTICLGQKMVFGPKQLKPGKTIKILVSAEIAKSPKWHLFLKEVFFDMGDSVGFTNCVLDKLCSSERSTITFL